MLLAHLGSYISMDRFVKMVKGLVLFLFLRMVPFFEFSNRLEEECINNQVEYEALLFGLEFLQFMGINMLKPLEILFLCSKYPRYANAIMVL